MSRAAQRSPLIVRLLALAFAVSLAPLSIAHEQKTALTEIFYNERTGNLEIAHRFSIHDAEHALQKATDTKGDIAKSAEAQAAFAKYVADRFELTFKDKSALKLTLVGQELERGYLWVYQETKIPAAVGAPFFIDNTILQGVVKGQVNTVNVRYRSQVATFVFEAESGRKQYSGPAEIKRKSEDLDDQ